MSGFLTAEEQRELDELLARGRRAFGENGDRGDREQDPRLDKTYSQLMAGPREDLDHVIRAVSLNEDLDYVEALDELGKWASLTGRGTDATLRQMIEAHSGLSCADFERDLAGIDRRNEMIDADVASADLPPKPDAERSSDGRVHFASTADKAAALQDDAIELAFLTKLDLDGAVGSDEGREAFERDYRLHVYSGIDYLAELQLDAHEKAAAEARKDAERRRLGDEQADRESRAAHRRYRTKRGEAFDELRRSL